MDIIYLNGQFIQKSSAKVSVLDRGFLFGDGVYEVIPTYQRKPLGLKLHLNRLDKSLNAIHIKPPYSLDQWKSILKQLMAANQLTDQNFSFYLQVTRGETNERLHEFPKNVTPTVMICCKTLLSPSIETLKKGFNAISLPDERRQNCYIKSINLLPNVLAYQQAKSKNAIEAILINNGYALEASSSNLFIVKNNILITPPLSPKILSGITRHIILQLAKQNAISVIERMIKENELYDADEVWVTGSNKEICPITQLNNQSISVTVGPLWHEMYQLYQHYKTTEDVL